MCPYITSGLKASIKKKKKKKKKAGKTCGQVATVIQGKI